MPGVLRQQALTALFPVRAERAEALVRELDERRASVCERLHGAGTVHFARFVLVPGGDGASDAAGGASDAAANARRGASDARRGASNARHGELLFATTFDGTLDAHLDELWALAGGELDAIFAHCAGFRAGGGRAELGRFVRSGLRPAAALYAAETGLSVARVRADAELRREIRRTLDAPGGELDGLGAEAIAARLRARLALGDGALGAGLGNAPATPDARLETGEGGALRFGEWLGLAGVWLRSLVLDVADGLGALWNDTPAGVVGDAGRGVKPGIGLAHCFSHVVKVKPGPARRRALRFVLRLLGRLTSRATGSGALAGARELHGARWVLLEDGRLIFLGDFAAGSDTAAGALLERWSSALGMIWSHTLGFPATLGWRFGGVRDEGQFRRWARTGALDAGIAYSAYPGLGCHEIHDNAELRRLLAAPASEGRARALLALVRD